MKLKNKGFTLVELLVVIAVIGILSSIVLVSLRNARGKGQDVKIISSVKQIKTIIESNYSGISYPDLTNDSPVFGGLVENGHPGENEIDILVQDITSQGSSVNIVNDPTDPGLPVLGYAIYGQLVSTSTQYFCIDSTGKTNLIAPTNDTSVCPQ
jgi:prepilin-type N-terminal cleavage/methylation domain-containing protein